MLPRAALLSSRDWVYSLSLLAPFVAYNLILKFLDVTSRPDHTGPGETLKLMLSDIFFNLGYAALLLGLFAVARRGSARRVVVVLFHVATLLVAVVTTLAHRYFQQTGATLDYGALVELVPNLGEAGLVLSLGTAPLSVWLIYLTALLYAAFGPWLLTRAVGWRRAWPGTGADGRFFAGSLGLFLLALGFGSLSLLVGFSSTFADAPLGRDRFANVVLTAVEREEKATAEAENPDADSSATNQLATDAEETTVGEEDPDASPVSMRAAAGTVLASSPRTERRNVVLVHLESARARSVTPYNESLRTMPFLDQVAKSSLLAERAYTVVPRSSKGSTAVNCGVEPPHYPGPEFEPGRIPSPCLGSLLKEQGYKTVYFQSVSDTANSNWDGVLARNFGYEEFYPPETMNTKGFKITNSFGYEEGIMLGPSEAWLTNNGYDGPFMAQYFTGTGHYGYECVPNRYGYERFSDDEELDRYHNCLRMLDHFLENLFDQYRRLGLYEETIFVFYGDHGEGFREHHDRYMHGDTIYEEGIRIPLIIHDPNRFQSGERVEGLSSQIDILPTVLEMLGFEVENGEFPGYSLLHPLPEDRTIRVNCIADHKCMASIKGYEKYVYNYGKMPDEFFDLSEDPLEQNNLADERSKEEMDQRREDLLAWRQRDDAEYGPLTFEGVPYQGAEE